MTTIYSAVFDYLGSPLTVEEMHALNLSEKTLKRLAELLQKECDNCLTMQEAAQLEGFKEAAFYLRMAKTAA